MTKEQLFRRILRESEQGNYQIQWYRPVDYTDGLEKFATEEEAMKVARQHLDDVSAILKNNYDSSGKYVNSTEVWKNPDVRYDAYETYEGSMTMDELRDDPEWNRLYDECMANAENWSGDEDDDYVEGEDELYAYMEERLSEDELAREWEYVRDDISRSSLTNFGGVG